MKLLLNHPKIDVNKASMLNEKTALYFASREGNKQVVEALLEHPNIDVNLVGSRVKHFFVTFHHGILCK